MTTHETPRMRARDTLKIRPPKKRVFSRIRSCVVRVVRVEGVANQALAKNPCVVVMRGSPVSCVEAAAPAGFPRMTRVTRSDIRPAAACAVAARQPGVVARLQGEHDHARTQRQQHESEQVEHDACRQHRAYVCWCAATARAPATIRQFVPAWPPAPRLQRVIGARLPGAHGCESARIVVPPGARAAVQDGAWGAYLAVAVARFAAALAQWEAEVSAP